MTITLYEVGGAVRDAILGVPTKDIDYSVVAPGGWDQMVEYLVENGFEIFLKTPQYLTVRAQFPRVNGVKRAVTADFVLARKDGEYTDGRRPDEVQPGTLLDDLARRDFTVNAIAKAEDGTLIDPFGGVDDLRNGVLRAVGDAEARITEDPLRALRAVRFTVTKGLTWDRELTDVLTSHFLPPLVAKVSKERRRDELHKALKHSTVGTLDVLARMPGDFRAAVFSDGLWLEPSLKS